MVVTRSQFTVSLACSVVAACVSFTLAASAQDGASALSSPILGTIPPWTTAAAAPAPPVDPAWQTWDPAYAMQMAELRAAPGGQRVLRAAQAMIDDRTIVRGSCYDWVDAVFTRASGHRHDAFHGHIERGPYAQPDDLQPGDWVLFVHSEYEGETLTHSAIFIGWADPSARIAVMVSYPGQRREEPGRYGTYDLSRAYRIIRLSDEPSAAHVHRATRAPHRRRTHSRS